MTDRLKLIRHKGKNIASIDYSDLQGEELIEHIKMVEEATERSERTDLLTLVNLEGAFIDRGSLAQMKSKSSAGTGKVLKCAVIGAIGVHQFFVDILQRHAELNVKLFDSREEALEWLVD